MNRLLVPVLLQFLSAVCILLEMVVPSSGLLTISAVGLFGYSAYLVSRHTPALLEVLACSLVVVLMLGTFARMDRELNYDESIYLNISRAIGNTGFPFRTAFADDAKQKLFVTSPPLVMAVASATQAIWPSEEIPSRAIHILVFVVPIYVMVWYIARQEYGVSCSCFAIVALMGQLFFLREAAFVRLDVPLSLFSLAALWAYYRAISSETAALRWSLVGAACLAASVCAMSQIS